MDRDHDAQAVDVMTPLLEACNVAIEGRLRPTDLVVDPGECVAVIGPNGGGKTSLLRALAGIEATSGTVRVNGEPVRDVTPARRPHLLTFLPASRDLVWPIRARDLIALGLPDADPPQIEELLVLLELDALADRRVDELSTGERTRVLLARALAPRPRLLLLDEPLSNLDPYWVLKSLEVIRERTNSGTAALVALHDIDRAPAFDRALLVDRGVIAADLPAAQMLESEMLAEAFRIERESAGDWRIRRLADRRSSP
jgi:iron complex transport system ATP-binding protein